MKFALILGTTEDIQCYSVFLVYILMCSMCYFTLEALASYFVHLRRNQHIRYVIKNIPKAFIGILECSVDPLYSFYMKSVDKV